MNKLSIFQFLVKITGHNAKRFSTEELLRISRNNLTKFLARVKHVRFERKESSLNLPLEHNVKTPITLNVLGFYTFVGRGNVTIFVNHTFSNAINSMFKQSFIEHLGILKLIDANKSAHYFIWSRRIDSHITYLFLARRKR